MLTFEIKIKTATDTRFLTGLFPHAVDAIFAGEDAAHGQPCTVSAKVKSCT